jgi:Reverse transcriptase (RNA-dependent DNA polymerase)
VRVLLAGERVDTCTSQRDGKEAAQRRRLTERLNELLKRTPSNPQQSLKFYMMERRLNKALAKSERERKQRRAASRNRIANLPIEELTYASYRLSHRLLSGADRNATALRHPRTNTLSTDTLSMLDAAKTFYEGLFTSAENGEEDKSDLADRIRSTHPVNRLTPEQKAQLLRPVTEEEVESLFSRLKSGRAPGHDGLGNDIYKAYSTSLSRPFTQIIEQFQSNPEVPDSMLRAIIVPFYKGKNERTDLKNWRPISLVCTDYKLLSLFIASRLTPVMQYLVNAGQTSSVPGRTTFDNIHAVRLLRHMTTLNEDIDSVFIFVDSEKAFDRVEWNYLWNTLNAMDFPPQFIQIVQALYAGASAQVRVNGYLTEPFKLTRGVRQGCPASPLLYVLTLEPIRCLVEFLVEQKGGKPGWLPPGTPSTFAHADDMVLIVASGQVQEVLSSLNFCASGVFKSGFRMNMDKSVALHTKASTVPPATQTCIPSFAWEDKEHEHLGLPIGGKNTDAKAKQTALERVEAKLRAVSPSKLPALEKVKLVNSRALGALQFYAQTVDFTETEAQQLSFKLIEGVWGPGKSKQKFVRHQRMTMPISEGGLGLIDVPLWLEAFRRNQLVRLHRATVRAEDDRRLVHTDTVLPTIFNFLVNAICRTKGMPVHFGSFFYLPQNVRQEITRELPPYWRQVLNHFERTLAHLHTVENVFAKCPSIDAVLACEVCVELDDPSDYMDPEDDVDLQSMYFQPVASTTNTSTNTTTTATKYQTPFGLLYACEPQHPAVLSLPRRTKDKLMTSTVEHVDGALNLVMNRPWYLMPLKVEAPLSGKGGTKTHYLRFKEAQSNSLFHAHTPEGEWAAECPKLSTLSGRLTQDARAHAVKVFRGTKHIYAKSHGWFLYQRRLTPPYWQCAWCGREGTRHNLYSSEEHFKHQAWDCRIFQLHWTRLRRKLGIAKINSLTEVALGLSADGKKTLQMNIRYRALALHTALWHERGKIENLDYATIIALFRRIMKIYEDREKRIKGKPTAP